MNKYIDKITKYRKPLIILLLIINIFSIAGILKIKISSDFEIFIPTKSLYKTSFEIMESDFSSSDQLIIQIEESKENISDSFLGKLKTFDIELSNKFLDQKISSPITNISNVDMISNQIEIFKELSPIKIVDDKMFFIYTLFVENQITKNDIKSIENLLDKNNLTYAMSGNSYIQLKVLDYIIYIITRIQFLTLIALLFVFNLKIKSIKATILSVLPAGMGALWTLGFVGWTSGNVSILTVLAPIFTIVIGSADGLHFISHVQEELADHGNMKNAIINTLKTVGTPMIVTTVTSIAGFSSLFIMNTDAIKGLALYASIGILLAGIATWFVLPVILLGDIKIHRKKIKIKDEKMEFMKFWGTPSIFIVIIVILIFTIGSGKVKQEFNMLDIYKKSTDVSKYNETISRVNGGTLPVYISGELPNGISSTETIKDILSLEKEIIDLQGIGKAVSAFDFMAILKNNSIPITEQNNMLSEFISNDKNKFRIIVFPKDHKNETLKSLQSLIDSKNGSLSKYNLDVTGVGFMMMELNDSMLKNQILSSLIALIIVFLLLLLSLRHLKSAIISLIPISLTLLFLFGFLGLTGISLNIITCTIFSITIGVGIDYAIHFTSIWRIRVKEGLSSEEAAISAYKYAGRPIIANAFGLSIGFTALMLSPLMIHVTVSTLMWAAMMSSVTFSLIILPTLLRRIKNS